jgi:uncharacterized membrane protein YraQ (UPF0718 family)
MSERAAAAVSMGTKGDRARGNVLVSRLVVVLILWIAVYVNLQRVTGWLAEDVLRLDTTDRLGSSAAFFAYEAPKVLLLLALVVFLVGILRSFFTPEKVRALLAGKRESVGGILAALLGTVTPFCSCSAVPLFIGFIAAGIPLGVTFSFLVAAPMVNEVALALLFGLFGWRIAVLYAGTGLAIAVISGWVLGRLRLESQIEPWALETHVGQSHEPNERTSWDERIRGGLAAVRDIVGRVWLYLLLGIAVGAGIHGYVPEDLMASIMGKGAWWSVPLAVLIGVPMYSNAAGIIPVVYALLEKGAALGTVLAFMMSVVALSLPEIIILRRILKPTLIMTFVGIVGVGIILVGYLFNVLI